MYCNKPTVLGEIIPTKTKTVHNILLKVDMKLVFPSKNNFDKCTINKQKNLTITRLLVCLHSVLFIEK